MTKTGAYTLTATSTSLTSGVSASLTITVGVAAGMILTNATNNAGAITPTCTGSGATWTCDALGGTLGLSGRFFRATVTLVDAGGNVAMNAGSPVTVTVTTTTPLASVSNSPVSVANNASNSSTQFTLNLPLSAITSIPANYTATATINGSTATLTGTVS